MLADANMAPNVRSTAISVPAPFKKMLELALGLEIDRLRNRRQLEAFVLVDCFDELGAFRGALAARSCTHETEPSRPVFFSTSLKSAQTSLSAALPPAVKIAHDLVFFLRPEIERAADLGTLEPRRHLPADDALAPCRSTKSRPATILKSGRRARDAG